MERRRGEGERKANRFFYKTTKGVNVFPNDTKCSRRYSTTARARTSYNPISVSRGGDEVESDTSDITKM